MIATRASLRDLYLLLAMGFTHPSDQLVEGIASGDFQNDLAACLRELGDADGADRVLAHTEPGDDLATRLRAEHFRLFVGSRSALVSPYESMMRAELRGETGMVMLAGSALDASKAYERFGMAARGQEPPDNIAYQLQFIALLLDEISAGSVDAEREHRRYITAHFTEWIDRFCTRVAEESRETFYTELAHALETVIRISRQQVA